jgi:Ca2+-binding EF-hand superfamily protein
MGHYQCGVKLAIAFKKMDKQDDGFVQSNEIISIFNDLKLQINKKEHETLLSMLSSKGGAYFSYHDILNLILGPTVG